MSHNSADPYQYRRRQLLLTGAGITLASSSGCLGGGAASDADAPAVAALSDCRSGRVGPRRLRD